MDKEKKEKLEAKGWKTGTVSDFLNLSSEENAIIELRLVLSDTLKKQRLNANLTQAIFAKKLGSSQSRVAKMEAGDPSVSIDLLIKSLFSTGVNVQKLGEALVNYKE